MNMSNHPTLSPEALRALRKLVDPDDPAISSQEIDQRIEEAVRTVRASGAASISGMAVAFEQVLRVRPRMTLLVAAVRDLRSFELLPQFEKLLAAEQIVYGPTPSAPSWVPNLMPEIAGEMHGRAAYGWDDIALWRTRSATVHALTAWAPEVGSDDAERVLPQLRKLQSDPQLPENLGEELAQCVAKLTSRVIPPERRQEAVVVGDTLEAARDRFRSTRATHSSQEASTLTETVVDAGQAGETTLSGATAEEARRRFATTAPGAVIVREDVLQPPLHMEVEIEAFDDAAARRSARDRLELAAPVADPTVTCRRPPKAGFLGIGRRAGLYRVVFDSAAKISFKYRLPAKVRYVWAQDESHRPPAVPVVATTPTAGPPVHGQPDKLAAAGHFARAAENADGAIECSSSGTIIAFSWDGLRHALVKDAVQDAVNADPTNPDYRYTLACLATPLGPDKAGVEEIAAIAATFPQCAEACGYAANPQHWRTPFQYPPWDSRQTRLPEVILPAGTEGMATSVRDGCRRIVAFFRRIDQRSVGHLGSQRSTLRLVCADTPHGPLVATYCLIDTHPTQPYTSELMLNVGHVADPADSSEASSVGYWLARLLAQQDHTYIVLAEPDGRVLFNRRVAFDDEARRNLRAADEFLAHVRPTTKLGAARWGDAQRHFMKVSSLDAIGF